ncbi:CRISPR-associated endonuclease Cas2 [Lachnobacterium bovis]|uniref:CRISPR-associated endoribonuclease Cas2 n=1 Tax=Lachnobacterium bovis DSM 14045 TaxID=1122142 RepID=A0A1H3KVN6_9FIRM|nr:CRISPR-associated endonuclease Cas2 [Lachnobacterium bovis]SDY55798.1 CRISPR-associated protein Cas2 [Lachnobacterium bovis DSM 14045]
MRYKVMRMLCMFDLPVDQASEKKAYRDFRKNLIKEGFVMMQYSVYVRTCPNREFAKGLENRVRKFAPPKGNVRLISITEKQYEDMKIIVGTKTEKESAYGIERMIII